MIDPLALAALVTVVCLAAFGVLVLLAYSLTRPEPVSAEIPEPGIPEPPAPVEPPAPAAPVDELDPRWDWRAYAAAHELVDDDELVAA